MIIFCSLHPKPQKLFANVIMAVVCVCGIHKSINLYILTYIVVYRIASGTSTLIMTLSLSDQFFHFTRNLLSPSSNAELQEATKWIESFRKKPDATTILMQLLNESNIVMTEGIFVTQMLKWTALRVALNGDNFNGMISHMLQLCPSDISPSLRNVGYVIAVLVIRSHIDGSSHVANYNIVSGMFESFSSQMSIELALNILKEIPEICNSRVMYRGPKAHVDSCIVNVKLSLLQDIFPVLATVGDCLQRIVHTASAEVDMETFDLCHDALSVIVEWTCLSVQMRNECVAVDYYDDVWINSGIIELVVAFMSLYSSTVPRGEDDMPRVIRDHVSIYQCCGEVSFPFHRKDLLSLFCSQGANNILGLEYSSVHLKSTVSSQVI